MGAQWCRPAQPAPRFFLHGPAPHLTVPPPLLPLPSIHPRPPSFPPIFRQYRPQIVHCQHAPCPPLPVNFLALLQHFDKMMFTYWPPGHNHPLLLQSPLRYALSLGDLPADPFFHLMAAPCPQVSAAHSFPLRTPKRAAAANEEEEEEEEEWPRDASTSRNATLLVPQRHSVGTQTENGQGGTNMPNKWQEEGDKEMDALCADIAQCLLLVADRWAAVKCQKKQGGGGGGIWDWLRVKLFG